MKNKLIQKIIGELRNLYPKKKINWRDTRRYKENIEKAYYKVFQKKLDLKNPKTFAEKMQWLRVYDNTPLKKQLADKYLVRNWVREKIGEEYLIPLLGAYDKFNKIDFDKLPDSFVIQCNHGCGYNIIVRDKKDFDIKSAQKKVNFWMKEDYAYRFGEIHYKDIKRKIIITQYLEELSGDISDYKYFCFNGKPRCIMYCSDRKSGVVKNSFFDLNWNNLKFHYFGELLQDSVEKPENLELMNKLAEKLAGDFPHVRVDFYNINGKIYFGEMTFTAYGGYFRFRPEEWNLKLGEMLELKTL